MAPGPRCRRYVVAAAAFLSVATLTYVVSGQLVSGQRPTAVRPPCLLANASYVPILPGFDQITDTAISELPLKAEGLASQARSYGFEGGRITGFIDRVALSEPYISEERARARSLGYPIGKWPLVPLEGQVVAKTPGILE